MHLIDKCSKIQNNITTYTHSKENIKAMSGTKRKAEGDASASRGEESSAVKKIKIKASDLASMDPQVQRIIKARVLVKKRDAAREEGDFEKSDEIRSKLVALGVETIDQKGGPSVSCMMLYECNSCPLTVSFSMCAVYRYRDGDSRMDHRRNCPQASKEKSHHLPLSLQPRMPSKRPSPRVPSPTPPPLLLLLLLRARTRRTRRRRLRPPRSPREIRPSPRRF